MNLNEKLGDPIWISVKGVQHYFLIGKTRCYELIKEDAIESKLDKKHGGKQGKRLIRFDSVADYIDNLPEGDGDEEIALSN
jgi:hypothetical protein